MVAVGSGCVPHDRDGSLARRNHCAGREDATHRRATRESPGRTRASTARSARPRYGGLRHLLTAGTSPTTTTTQARKPSPQQEGNVFWCAVSDDNVTGGGGTTSTHRTH